MMRHLKKINVLISDVRLTLASRDFCLSLFLVTFLGLGQGTDQVALFSVDFVLECVECCGNLSKDILLHTPVFSCMKFSLWNMPLRTGRQTRLRHGLPMHFGLLTRIKLKDEIKTNGKSHLQPHKETSADYHC